MMKSKFKLSGSQALFGAAILFAVTNVLIRGMSEMWGDQAQVASRFLLVWLILIVIARIKKDTAQKIPRSRLPTALAYSLIAATAILFFTLSVQNTIIANTLFSSNATELFVAFLLGTLFLSEKLTVRKLIAITLAVAGLLFYSGSILEGSVGILFGILGGASTAFCNLLAKKLKGVDLGALMRMQFGVGAIFMSILTLLISPNDIIRTVTFEGVMSTILFAVILIIATRLVLYGFQNSDINIASVILSSQLAFGALIGYLAYNETLSVNEIISGVFILSAAIMVSVDKDLINKIKDRLARTRNVAKPSC